jgi:hypothetical protein
MFAEEHRPGEKAGRELSNKFVINMKLYYLRRPDWFVRPIPPSN